MKRTYAIASTLALVAAASQAQAQTNPYRGSDTLEVFTRVLAQQCGTQFPGEYSDLAPVDPNTGAAGDFRYLGTGSGNGQNDIAAGCADFAPMSRALNAAGACVPNLGVGRDGEPAINLLTSAGECQDHDGNPATPNVCNNVVGGRAHGEVIGLDGLAIIGGNDASNNVDTAYICDTDGNDGFNHGALLVTTGDSVGAYNFNNGTATVADDWRDVLRVLWSGAENGRSAVDGGGSNQNAVNRALRCNSTVRRAIVADWLNILHTNTSCGTSCGPVRHLLRRDLSSGTSDVFTAVLGIAAPGGTNVPFCNGNDQEDLDPIRIACSTGGGLQTNNSTTDPSLDDICQRDGTLGLVTPITVPPEGADPGTAGLNVSNADLYPVQACSAGSFQLRRNFRIGLTTQATCADGTPAILQNCWTPSTGGANQDCNCVNRSTSRSPSMGGVGDGRVYNKHVRRARLAVPTQTNPLLQCPYVRPPLVTGLSSPGNSDMVTAFYRLSTLPGGGTSSCSKGSSTEQLGCLADVIPCSLAYAGQEGVNSSGVQPSPGIGVAMTLDGTNADVVDAIGPDTNRVQAFIDGGISAYAFSRKLYFNSIIGFGNFRTQTDADPEEHKDLIHCLRTKNAPGGPVDLAFAASGFVKPPASVGGVSFCEDINEAALCGAAVNYNACDVNTGSAYPTL